MNANKMFRIENPNNHPVSRIRTQLVAIINQTIAEQGAPITGHVRTHEEKISSEIWTYRCDIADQDETPVASITYALRKSPKDHSGTAPENFVLALGKNILPAHAETIGKELSDYLQHPCERDPSRIGYIDQGRP
ncbi:MAG: hypothetical protein GXP63_00775 [DPANN group archaeon]|nr:hypothetical protein [DPANN group archaeon]